MNQTRLRRMPAGLALGLLPILALADARGDVEKARSAFAEWSQIKSQISSERSEWKQEKALLADTLVAAKAESAALDSRITELHAASTDTDRKRGELTAQIADLKTTAEGLAATVAAQEAAARQLLPLLPETVKSELQPLLQRLPASSEDTKLPLSQRVQTLVALLAQIEKFASNLNLVSEIRDLGAGRTVEVKTLYFGLSVAYFADAGGATVGYGVAGPAGWDWKTAEGAAAERIALAIAVHENTKPPAFVSLPVQVR